MVAAIILLCLMVLGLGIALAKHGQPRKDPYNFWTQLISFIISIVLLYFAHFFDIFIK